MLTIHLAGTTGYLSGDMFAKVTELQRQNQDSAERLRTLAEELEQAKELSKEKESEVAELAEQQDRTTRLGHLLGRVSEEQFANFITDLCAGMIKCIVSELGVVDKFRGDGILAFYPEFFSGKDAVVHAVRTAKACMSLFAEHYKNHRHCFSTVLKDAGLGIGIDYGEVFLTTINNDATVIGKPVVYACRISASDHTRILANETVRDAIETNYKDAFKVAETDLTLKHEGSVVVYEVTLVQDDFKCAEPEWRQKTSAMDAPKVVTS